VLSSEGLSPASHLGIVFGIECWIARDPGVHSGALSVEKIVDFGGQLKAKRCDLPLARLDGSLIGDASPLISLD
jgi:hypothetical protein